MPFQKIEIRPLAGALGAEIRNVDLSTTLNYQTKVEINQAFLNHLVIVFRDQLLTPKEQVKIARIFGKPAIYPFLQGLKGEPEVNELLKTEKDLINFGGSWHSDTAYKECPDSGTLLYAHEVPEFGGDTQFCNMYLAYDALSDGMKKLLSSVRAIYSSEKGYNGNRAEKMKSLDGLKDTIKPEIKSFESEHPIIRTHPETGRKGLYVSESHTLRLTNMSVDESEPLINYLSTFAMRPEFTCRLRWKPQTLAIWDNRCTNHYAINDYAGSRRRMHRITIEGDKPF